MLWGYDGINPIDPHCIGKNAKFFGYPELPLILEDF